MSHYDKRRLYIFNIL